MIINKTAIKVIAFDADDTLWVNEPYFQKAEHDLSRFPTGQVVLELHS